MQEFDRLDQLPPHLREALAPQLAADESLAWAGQPTPLEVVSTTGQRAVQFAGLFFWIMAGVVEAVMAGTESGGRGHAFALLFVACGVALLCAPVWVRMWAARRLYAITSHRVLALDGRLAGPFHITAYMGAALGHARMRELADGSGDIIFSSEQYEDDNGDIATHETGLKKLPGVAAKLALIRAAAVRAGATA